MSERVYTAQDRANEGCCWDYIRSHCPGGGCTCRCHIDIPARPANEQEMLQEIARLRRQRDAALDARIEQLTIETVAPCSKSKEFRDGVTCSKTRLDGVCHNHEVVAGLRHHAIEADQFELENRRLRNTLKACQGIIHVGQHGGKDTEPEHHAACEMPSCRRIRAALAASQPAPAAEAGRGGQAEGDG